MRKGTIVVAVLAMLLALVGCGDGDSSLSKAEYKNEVRLVCNESEQRIEELVSQLKQEYQEREQVATAKYQAENLLKVIDSYDETTEELADIGLPEGEEKKVEAFIQEREEAAAKVKASPLGTRDAFPVIFKGANEMAEEVGAAGCVV